MRKVSFKTIRGEVGSPTYDNWDVGAQMAIERLEDDKLWLMTTLQDLWFESRSQYSQLPGSLNYWQERLKLLGMNPHSNGV